MQSPLSGIDVIYWINLERSSDRRDYMNHLLRDDVFSGIPAIRVNAIDGKSTPHMFLNHYKIERQSRCSDVEYACLLSHLETIREFSNTNYEVALILEDDVTLDFQKYWSKTVREVMDTAPRDWEIIQLCYMTEKKNIPSEDYVTTYGTYFSAAAYIVKRPAAKRLISELYDGRRYRLDNVSRHVADEYIYKKLRTYTYRYPFFIYKANNTTTLMHNNSLAFHESSRRDIEEVLYNSPPARSYNPFDYLVFMVALIGVLLIVLSQFGVAKYFNKWL